MKILLINGPVVDDSDAWFYDFWGDPYISPKVVRDFLDEANGEDIQLSINSGGGSVFAGSEIYTMLKSYSGKVDVVVSGLAGSIASVIMLAGDTIKASPMAQVMIHNATMHAHGDYRDFEHASVVIGGVSQSLIGLYANKTGMTEDEIKELVDAESWFGAEKAKELGLVDEILFQDNFSLVASVGAYRSKEQIMEMKALIDKKQNTGSIESIFNRLEEIEKQLNEIGNRPIQQAKIEIDSEELEQAIHNALNNSKIADKTQKSLFSKFI